MTDIGQLVAGGTASVAMLAFFVVSFVAYLRKDGDTAFLAALGALVCMATACGAFAYA